MSIRINKWKEFQHYKHRDPPWIRLYRKLLDKREWHKLSGDDAKLLVELWLLASENDGYLPPIEDIVFRLRLPEQQVVAAIQRLSEDWLKADASTVRAVRLHGAVPETESDTESDTEQEDIDTPSNLVKGEFKKIA